MLHDINTGLWSLLPLYHVKHTLPAAFMPFSVPFILFYACYMYWEIRANVKKHQIGKSLGPGFSDRTRNRAYSD